MTCGGSISPVAEQRVGVLAGGATVRRRPARAGRHRGGSRPPPHAPGIASPEPAARAVTLRDTAGMAPAPDLRIALLGPLLVEVGGKATDIPRGHQRRLLVALALDAGRVVSVERLVDLLWSEDPPPSARNSLQSHLARLRRRLGGDQLLRRQEPGYRLIVADEDVDVRRFERLVAEAERASNEAGRLVLLDEALGLWRSDEPDVIVANGFDGEAVRLVRHRMTAHVARATAAVAAGDLRTAEADARAALEIDPLDEPAVVVLVRVLAMIGRVAEADDCVQRFRQELANTLGLDPSPALDEVHVALLRGELGGATASAAGAGSTVVSGDPSPTGEGTAATTTATDAQPLSSQAGRVRPPLPRSSFRGRHEALRELAELVGSTRMVTLVGPGGVGKTRMALEMVHRGSRRIVWVDLLDARARGDVLGRLALTAGCATPTDLAALHPLSTVLTDSAALVVLDNCEQAVDEIAVVVDALVDVTRATTILATSRVPLGVDGEVVFELRPLPTLTDDGTPSPAMELLADRMGRNVALDDPGARGTAAELVVALDGLPLALELAARQVRSLGLEAVRDRLDDRLDLLETRRVPRHPAHTDLRTLVHWSTDNLDDEDGRAFRWLSTFAGPFTLAQAERLLGPGGAGLRAAPASVSRLVEQSLVQRTSGVRFRMLETMRASAAEDLAWTGEGETAQARHTEVVISAAEAAGATIGSSAEVSGMRVLDALVADLQVVTERLVDAEDAVGMCRLAVAVCQYAYDTQRPEVLRAARAAERLLVHATNELVSQEQRAGALVAAAVEAAITGDLGRARTLLEAVIAEGESAGAHQAAAWAFLGDVGLWEVADGTEDAYRRAITLGDEYGHEAAAVWAWTGVCLVHAYGGDAAHARLAAEEVRRRARCMDSTLFQAWAAYARGEADANDRPEDALAAFDDAIQHATIVGGHLVAAAAAGGAAVVRARHGDPVPVLHDIQATLRMFARSGHTSVRHNVLRNLAVLLARMGRDEVAVTLLCARQPPPLYEIERRRVDDVMQVLTGRMGQAELRRRAAQGAGMTDEMLVTLALATVDDLLAQAKAGEDRSE